VKQPNMMRNVASLGMLGVGVAMWLAMSMARTTAQVASSVSIDNDDIGGVVTSTKGPEAGSG